MEPLIGGLPQTRTPLNARVTGSFERPGYRVENVIFDSLPGFRVTANLYVPTQGQPPYPAVLGTAGHSDAGKAHSNYQRVWISLARRGYVVLAYDPPGQGERVEYFDPELGRSRLTPGVNEHIQAGLQCLLTGAPIARYFIWDGIRAFDYLLTRREVDPKRVAVAGNSGGGTQAAYLAVFEPRLAAVASSCYMTRWSELLEGPGPQDAEQVMPGFLSAGFDFVDFARAAAPRPFLLTAATRDFFPIAGARATAAASPNISFYETDATHGWSQPLREAAYSFFDRVLKGVSNDLKEAPVDTEPETALWATPTGQLADSIGSETVFTLNRNLARDMYPKRKALSLTGIEALRALVRQRLAVTLPEVSRPAARTGRAAVIVSGVAAADVEELRKAGFAVRIVDPPRFPEGRGGYTGAYQSAAREWLYGRSLVAARMSDLHAAYRELAADPQVNPARIAVWGRGNAGVAALLLAALEPGVEKVLAEGTLTSWYAATQTRWHESLAEVVVPGVLADFDLPDLVRAIAPRPVWLVSPRTPAGGRSTAGEYDRAPVRVLDRPEGWPVTGAYREWLGPAAAR